MVRRVLRWLLVVLLVAQGINHFIATDLMVRMIPAYLPAARTLVLLSGVAEVLLGLMMISPKSRRLAGWGTLALLVAVFPANLQMALHPEQWPSIPAISLYLRLPGQLIFAYWAYGTCIQQPSVDSDSKTG